MVPLVPSTVKVSSRGAEQETESLSLRTTKSSWQSLRFRMSTGLMSTHGEDNEESLKTRKIFPSPRKSYRNLISNSSQVSFRREKEVEPPKAPLEEPKGYLLGKKLNFNQMRCLVDNTF